MTLTIPAEIEAELAARAEQRQVSLETLVREALGWYLRMDAVTVDEFTAWQEIRDEALELVEERPN